MSSQTPVGLSETKKNDISLVLISLKAEDIELNTAIAKIVDILDDNRKYVSGQRADDLQEVIAEIVRSPRDSERLFNLIVRRHQRRK